MGWLTFAKPLSCMGGMGGTPGTPVGCAMYTCTTSDPGTVPVFVTITSTTAFRSFGSAVSSVTERSENVKVVYDSPKLPRTLLLTRVPRKGRLDTHPNGKSGSTCLA